MEVPFNQSKYQKYLPKMAFRTVAQLDEATNDEKTDINSVLPAEMLFLTFLYLSPQDLVPVQVDGSGPEK